MPITNSQFKTIRDRAVAALEREFGEGRIRFQRGTLESAPSLSFQIEVQDAQAAATLAETQFRNLFMVLHPDMRADDFGKTVVVKGRAYRISGCNPRRPKFNVILTRDDGQESGASADMVVRLLRSAKAAA